ncbi:MAG: fibronectin type III domain-containing protein [Prosthecobacter sp.]|uniref:fibronectin type III domain-containing protein n=1 Tax=Prosthecobacter sp. TaxID=1965333 RepID=UPI0039038C21
MPHFDDPLVHFDDPLVFYDDPRTYQEILNSQSPHTMFDVVLDLKNLSVPALIARIRAILTATSEQAVFASLAADLTALEAKVKTLSDRETDLRAAENAVTMATTERDKAEKGVTDGAIALASAVGTIATTEAQVESTLMRVKGPPAPKPIPDQPTGLELKMGDADGELSGQCNGQPGIVEYYEIQYTATDPLGAAPNWQHADTSKKSRFELTGLPSGQKVWVRLRACNARGKSTWSDPACKRVP